MKTFLSAFTVLVALGVMVLIISQSWSTESAEATSLRPHGTLANQSAPVSGDTEVSSLSDQTKNSQTFEMRAEVLEGMLRDGEREAALRDLTMEWAAQNPTAAERWAKVLPDAVERETALNYVARTWGETDPSAAVQMAERDHLTQVVVDDLAQRWAEKNFPAAQNWALDLPSGPVRDQTLSRILVVRAETDPSAAAALVTRKLAAGPVQQEAVMSVLYQWLPRDQAAASAWVAQFPVGAFRTRAEDEVQAFLSRKSSESPSPSK